MKTSNPDVEERMKRFEQLCRGAGVKLTHQRMEIFREVAQSGLHPDAETVCQGVRQRVPTVSLDTVYRTLWLLDDLGLIRTLGSPRERSRFDANLSQHHHFVCMKCGLTRDFYSEDFDGLRLPASIKRVGRVDTTHVEARGVCRQCARKDDGKPRISRREERR